MAHSILSPSSTSRIVPCPYSAIPNAEAPRTSSPAAAKGTGIHEMCEALLKDRLDGIELSDYYLSQVMEVEGHQFEITQEEIDMVEIYVGYIKQRTKELNGKLLIEEKLHATLVHEELWGTADAVILGEHNRMEIVDLKSGAFPVDVRFNYQLMTYGVAALYRYGNENTVVQLTIVQPNKKSFHKDGTIRSWDIQAHDLDDWAQNILKPACEEALGENPSAKAGDHCKFCVLKQNNTCETYKTFIGGNNE